VRWVFVFGGAREARVRGFQFHTTHTNEKRKLGGTTGFLQDSVEYLGLRRRREPSRGDVRLRKVV